MADFLKKCEKYFGSKDFYEILGVDRAATDKEIKKAYHRLSLLVHPDRVDEHHKKESTEKFKVLGRIHSILQEKERRKCYDDYGEFDEEGESTKNWMDYWRNLFKPITVEDIQKYEQEYIGSETELRDIKKAYLRRKGNMDDIFEMVPFSNCDSEARIIGIVQKMVDDGEVERYDRFFNEPKSKKERRRKKYEKEKKDSEALVESGLLKEFEERKQKRSSNFLDMIAQVEEKYGKKKTVKRKSLKAAEEDPVPEKRTRTTRSSKK